MGMKDDDDTVYCDIQMPLAQGRELLLLVTALRESNSHPTLNRVFERMQRELSISIDIVENPPTWGPKVPVRPARPSEHCIPSVHRLGDSHETMKLTTL